VPRTALLGRAPWGTQTRSNTDREARALNFAGPAQEEDPTFDSFMRDLDTPLPPPTNKSKKKKQNNITTLIIFISSYI
jgi:hypothetical protein